MAAPGHFDVEVLSALRGRMLGRHLTTGDLRTAAKRLAALPIRRHPVEDPLLLLEAVRWFHNLTAYDAMYPALTKLSRATLVTGDRALADTVRRATLASRFIDCAA